MGICQQDALRHARTNEAEAIGFSAAATSENERPLDVESMPSKCDPVAIHAQPTFASMATRPCLSSAARMRLKLPWSIFSVKPRGSQTLLPTSMETPGLQEIVVRQADLRLDG